MIDRITTRRHGFRPILDRFSGRFSFLSDSVKSSRIFVGCTNLFWQLSTDLQRGLGSRWLWPRIFQSPLIVPCSLMVISIVDRVGLSSASATC